MDLIMEKVELVRGGGGMEGLDEEDGGREYRGRRKT